MQSLTPLWLRVFLSVVEHGSFNKAAEALYLSQPAVSQRIRQLERWLGVTLFKRTPQGVQLTEAGRVFLTYAQDMQRLLRAAEKQMLELRQDRPVLHIGATPSVATHRLPGWIRRFHQRYPHILLSLHTDTTPNLVKAVSNHDLPLAFIEGELPRETEVRYLLLREIPFRVVAPKNSPWRGRHVVRLEDLDGQPLVTRPPDSQTRKWMERLFRERGVHPRVVAELDTPEAIKHAVAQGLGISLLPECVLRPDDPLLVLDIADGPVRRFLKAIWPKDSPLLPPARAFLEGLTQEFPHLRPSLEALA